MTLQNKVAAVMIYPPLLLICLASTKLSFIAPFIAVLNHCPSWVNSQCNKIQNIKKQRGENTKRQNIEQAGAELGQAQPN